MEILGTTIDDAAGEAFDKTGKMLGLPYPAGPHIDRLAALGHPVFTFSKAQLPDFDFSFSGFKTSVLYFLQNQTQKDPDFIKDNLHDLCASIQSTIIDMLTAKLIKAVEATGITRVAIAGGVSANRGLRNKLTELATIHGWDLFIPSFEYCTDNAAMIGINAYFKYLDQNFETQDMTADPRLAF
jgi:N6-L-threonylcarbamoyladenine synthase